MYNPPFREKPIQRKGLPKKKGAWTVCQFKRRAWKERRGGVFKGVDAPVHTVKYIRCFARFEAIRTIQKMWKTPMEECHFE